ncbi:MAG: alpha/beta hydrolase [Magnetococcales bacterium]|nr:alpha/beta hydrolase [Magnetococcales bacterium]
MTGLSLKTHWKARRLALKRRLALLLHGHFDPYPPPPEGFCLSPSASLAPLFDAPPTRLAWRKADQSDPLAWQETARAKLTELLGLRPAAREIQVVQVSREKRRRDGIHTLTSHLRLGEAGPVVPVVTLWDPKKAVGDTKKVMIVLQGTNAGYHLSWGGARMPADPIKVARGNDFALEPVRQGYHVLCLEISCFGERMERDLKKRSADPCIDTANHLLLLGRTLLGERVRDVMDLITWLSDTWRDREENTDRRIEIIGHSSGGMVALYAMALDRRIRAGLISGSLGTLSRTVARRNDCSGQSVVPGLLNWLEMDDIAALCAPRPLLAVAGVRDHIWPYSGAEECVASARTLYDALDAPKGIQAVSGEGGHRFYPEQAWPPFFQMTKPSSEKT